MAQQGGLGDRSQYKRGWHGAESRFNKGLCPPHGQRQGQFHRPARATARRKLLPPARNGVTKPGGRLPEPVEYKLPSSTQPNVVDDFPETVAVLDCELETLETYLGSTLNGLLGDAPDQGENQ